jgi:sterol 3beta-glucosyltransferase
MRISIITIGSRGDVQPYVALGQGLQRAGHSVCLITHAVFADFVRSFKLDFAALDDSSQELFQTEVGQAMLSSDGVLLLHHFVRATRPLITQYLELCWSACRGTDAIISSLQGFFYGKSIAEKLGVPFVCALVVPTPLPTRAFADPAAPRALVSLYRDYGPLNFLTHVITRHIFWTIFLPYIDTARKKILNLPPFPIFSPFQPFQRSASLVLLGYSPVVVPRPPEWDLRTVVTGYWFLETERTWRPPPALLRFLEAGPPPIYVGFGSMSCDDPVAMTALVSEALANCQQRGILLTGWGGLGSEHLPDHVYAIKSVSHDWLFPRVAAAVHHGGAGTTGASLRAGLPTMIVPFLPDQAFWGERVFLLGAGPRAVPRRLLTVAALQDAIQQVVQNPEMRRRANEIGLAIRAEQGVERAVEMFQRHIVARRRHSRVRAI